MEEVYKEPAKKACPLFSSLHKISIQLPEEMKSHAPWRIDDQEWELEEEEVKPFLHQKCASLLQRFLFFSLLIRTTTTITLITAAGFQLHLTQEEIFTKIGPQTMEMELEAATRKAEEEEEDQH